MLSVLITAYDQHDLTIAHIKGCMNSDFMPDEIIAVNDGGTDDLKEKIRNIENKKCPIIYAKIIEDIRWNQNGARNLGLFLSRGDIIALEDNDHIPSKTFYRDAMKLIYNGYDYVFTSKRVVVSLDDILNNPQEDWKPLNNRGEAKIIAIVKREILLGIKGFDEEFCGYYGWDVPDFVDRADRLGVKSASVNYYYTAPVYSRMNDRGFMGDRPKMEPHNYHLRKRNERNKIIQKEKGILNFKYEVCRF